MGSNRAENVRLSTTEAGNGTRAWLRLRPLRHCSKRFEVEEKKEVMRYWKLRMRLLEKNSRAAKITKRVSVLRL